jgi:hypothetical protein
MSIDFLPGLSSDASLPGNWFDVQTGEDFALIPVPAHFGSQGAARWLPVATYEAVLNALLTESEWYSGTWEPDTPEQTADRAAITEALLDAQAAVITRDDD